MIARVEQRALQLLRDGYRLSKYDLADIAHCHQRTAQRMLARIWNYSDDVKIVEWATKYRSYIPVYGISRGKDKARPTAMTVTERSRKRRKDPEVRWDEMLQQRRMRIRKRHEAKRNSTA